MTIQTELDKMAEWYERKEKVVAAARKAQSVWQVMWNSPRPLGLMDNMRDAMGELYEAIEGGQEW